ncbi:hypothetical protein TNCV_2231261 [Trichonephila clavipes]|nr:hypothetical protein TNCV_2231261 [Trichonephila clavipes]
MLQNSDTCFMLYKSPFHLLCLYICYCGCPKLENDDFHRRMLTHSKYVSERSNIVLQSCAFGLSQTYVNNHRYALEKVEKRGADKEATVCFQSNPLFCWESVSFVSLMQGLMGRTTFS